MKYWIITYGCQANISDSERIEKFLSLKGKPACSRKQADLVVINSCSVRQSAVSRVYGQIQLIRKESKAKVIVTGCLLEEDRKKIDCFVTIEDLLKKPFLIEPLRKNSFSALIPIMTGCNNFCTYCAVPYTKGREKSRKTSEIMKEVKQVSSQGFKEIWLLGQNVNSYQPSFSDLIKKVSLVPGNFWVRFTSSHPKDFSKETIKLMKNSEKITPYLNLPIQSGSNETLKRMNRPYTVEEYKKCAFWARKEVPDLFLSTDIIVGFPGETKKQFQETVKVFKEVKFDMAYISRYSPRPGTKAYSLLDNVPFHEKRRREEFLNQILEKMNLKRNKKLVKKRMKILVDKEKNNFVWGKTKEYLTVKVKSKPEIVGEFIEVEITGYSPWGLEGKIV